MSLGEEVRGLILEQETVEIPRLKKSVKVIELGADELVDYFKTVDKLFEEPDRALGRRWLLVARCTFDDAGARIWSDEDSKELGKKSGWLMTTLFMVAGRLNGILKEDSAKNSETSPSGTSA